MSWEAAVAIGIPAVVAVAGYFVAYGNNLRLAARNDRLDRVNRQLQELYGPLVALVHAGNRSWEVFRIQNRPGGSYWGRDPPPTDQEAHAWRLWVSTVFMPLNRQMRDAVVTHADLLLEDEVESCLLDLCAHVAAYEAILTRWEAADYSEHAPPLPFPRERLSAYVGQAYRRLKLQQKALLREQPGKRRDESSTLAKP
jgi:hypothetical protein